ncbi:MAG TPA: hypothetical protein VIY49_11090 [Bryobacteraceae bacterium]
MYWTFDSLWQKAKIFAKRGLEAERTGPLFPFWMSLALEALARATVAKVHPALLADPQDGGGESLWYAFGYPPQKPQPPKSIQMKTVLIRCKRVTPEFTDREEKFCLGLVDLRNRELHSGEPVFDAYPTRLWLAEYYRVCKILLLAVGKELDDMLGRDEAAGAEQMVGEMEKQTQKEALDLIARARESFENLPEEEREHRRAVGGEKASQSKRLSGTTVDCPACGAKAVIAGKRTGSSEPRLRQDVIVQEHAFIPVKLSCPTCGLSLEGYGLLHAAGLGGQFSAIEEHDPVEFHGIDPYELVDPHKVIEAYFEPEYGND